MRTWRFGVVMAVAVTLTSAASVRAQGRYIRPGSSISHAGAFFPDQFEVTTPRSCSAPASSSTS